MISRLILTLLLFSNAQYAMGAEFEDWEAVLDQESVRKIDLGQKVSDVVFDAIDNIKLFKHSDENFEVKLEVKRKIFDNNGISNDWTVMDQFLINGRVGFSIPGTLSSTVGAGISLGSRQGIEFTNVRQVRESEILSLPSVLEVKKRMEQTIWFQNFKKRKFEKDNSSTHDKDFYADRGIDDLLNWCPFPKEDSENRAKFCKFLNLITFPFRLPLKADVIEKMEDSEIISYTGSGVVSLGAHVGWSLDAVLIGFLSAGAAISTYVSGVFEISVLKENDRHVRVKVARTFGRGSGASVGGQDKATLLDGIFLVEKIGKYLDIVPFSLSVSKSMSQLFDVTYRYDLTNPDAVIAYEEAVIGKLAYSEQLAVSPEGKPRDPRITGVEKVYTTKRATDSTGDNRQLRLSAAYRKNSNTNRTNIDTTITFPNGDTKIFESISHNSREWKLFWAFYQKLYYRFSVNANLNRFEADPFAKDALTIVASGRIEDSHTKKKEMMNYILEAEDTVGKFGLFPRPPGNDNLMPIASTPEFAALAPPVGVPLPRRHLGKSKTYFHIVLDNGQIRDFIDTPDSEKWSALESVFGLKKHTWESDKSRFLFGLLRSPLALLNFPLYLADINIRQGSILPHATKLFDNWKKLGTIVKPKKLAQSIGEMFTNAFYSYELVHLLRTVMDGETVPYLVSGSTPYYGRFRKGGQTILRAKDIATIAQEEIDDARGGRDRPAGDTSAVENLIILSADAEKIIVSFDLEQDPKALFFQLHGNRNWFKKDIYVDLLVYNNGGLDFVKGQNVVIIDLKNPQDPWTDLAKKISSRVPYRLKVSANPDGLGWGQAAAVDFQF